jgi:DNA polymerase-3 subunit epsilon
LWLKLTDEPYPRLAVVRKVADDGASYLGPFSSARAAQAAMAAVHETVPLRQCIQRLSPKHTAPACVLAGMGRCPAPCEGGVSVDDYAPLVEATRAVMHGDPRPLLDAARRRMGTLSAQHRFEEAAAHRDRATVFIRAAARLQRLSGLARCPELVAAQPRFDGGWDLAVVRHGRLVAAGVAPPGAAPRPYISALVATAETVVAGPGPLASANAEEMDCILRWLAEPGTRLVELDGIWSSPALGAGGLGDWLDVAESGRAAARPFDDRRGLRPVHRPHRAAG